MARLGILRRVLFTVVVASPAFSYHGSCAINETKAETKAPHTDPAPKMKNNIFRVDLIRRDSPLSPLVDGRILSNAERLRRAIQRSHNRLRRFQQYTSQNAKGYYSPITAEDGEFLMQMAIGSPVPLNLHFILDTGSDLIWTQCQLRCSNSCVAQNDPMYNPLQSSSYRNVPCSNNFCLAAQLCDTKANLCIYHARYGDGSSTCGVLAYETFSLATVGSRRRVSLPNISFGCSLKQEGHFSDSTGIIGMGRGRLSLVSQIGSSIDNVFSYCLGSIDNASQVSPVFLGRAAATLGAGFRVTPLVPNTRFPTFYYLGLRGISVAGKAVPIPKGTFEIQADGRGGLIIDSGTTITSLEEPGYKPFLNAVRSSIPANAFATMGFDLCYNATPALRFPAIAFHFAGGARYVIPINNSFLSFSESLLEDAGGIVCLAFNSSGVAGSTSIFGNVQQQNFHIVYDLGHNNLYFAPTNCASN